MGLRSGTCWSHMCRRSWHMQATCTPYILFEVSKISFWNPDGWLNNIQRNDSKFNFLLPLVYFFSWNQQGFISCIWQLCLRPCNVENDLNPYNASLWQTLSPNDTLNSWWSYANYSICSNIFIVYIVYKFSISQFTLCLLCHIQGHLHSLE